MRKILLLAGLVVLALFSVLAVEGWQRQTAIVASPSPIATITVTPSLILPTPSPTPSPSPSPSPVSTATSVNLMVPFTIQAPDSQWVEPWKEGCEEAALLMAHAYNMGDRQAVLPVAETKQKIADMVTWQHQRFGGHYDLGVDEMAIIAREYLGYDRVTVKHSVILEDIRNELRRGKPVIVPAAGRLLKNPYFTPPGPPYHVFVITGFEGSDFIVNENGTRQGRGHRYSAEILDEAIHDYRRGVGVTDLPKAYLVLEEI